jgi:hypothetical protein
MAIKDPDINKIVEKIGDHYTNNVNNRFIRKALVTLDLQQSEWDKLDGLTTNSDYYKAQGYQFDELYEMILAAAHFIFKARQSILPNIKSLVGGHNPLSIGKSGGGSEQDKILRDMAARNFPMNLEILTDLVNELYVKTTHLDKLAHGKKPPVFDKIPELKELGRYLVSS